MIQASSDSQSEPSGARIGSPLDVSDPRPRRRWPVMAAVFVGILIAVEISLRFMEPNLPIPLDWPIANMQAKYDQIDLLAQSEEEIDVVFVGSSVVFDGINPLTVDEAAPWIVSYNAGIAGAISTRTWEWWTTEVVIPKLKPDVLVIGVASVDLNSNDPDVFWGPFSRSRGFGRVEAGSEGSLSERVEKQIEEWSALFRLRTVLRRPVRIVVTFGEPFEEDLIMGPFGSEPRIEEIDPYELTDDGKRRIEEGQLKDFEPEGENLQYLETLVNEVVSADIKVVLVNMPVTDDYVNLHPRGESDYTDFVRTLEYFADDHGIQLLDFGREIESLDLFRDPSHLNYMGADVFSRMLAAALVGESS